MGFDLNIICFTSKISLVYLFVAVFVLVGCSFYPPLHTAILKGETVEAEKIIQQSDTDINERDREGRLPIHLAAAKGQESVVSSLIQRGAELEATTNNGLNALSLAVQYGHLEVAKLLVDHGASVNPPLESSFPLMVAAKNGEISIAQFLIDKGANLDARNRDGDTALYIAAYSGQSDMAIFLINAGADPVLSTYEGMTVYHAAALMDLSKLLDTLFAIDINVKPLSGSEEQIHSTAKLAEYATRYTNYIGDNQAAVKYAEVACEFYARSATVFEENVKNIKTKIVRIHIANFLSALVASVEASAQAKTNQVITPGGKVVGVGSSTYTTYGTEDLRKSKSHYEKLAKEYRSKAESCSRS